MQSVSRLLSLLSRESLLRFQYAAAAAAADDDDGFHWSAGSFSRSLSFSVLYNLSLLDPGFCFYVCEARFVCGLQYVDNSFYVKKKKEEGCSQNDPSLQAFL